METELVRFPTDDGVNVVGDLTRPVGEARAAAILLHMMPARRDSWRELTAALAARGVACLAIDLRGHGDSVTTTDGRRLNYRDFSDGEHQQTRGDVTAAVAHLRQSMPGLATVPLVLIGASIGANLSLRFAADHPEVKAVVAMSPGLDYRGVTTAEAVQRLSPRQSLWLGASRDDQHGSWEAVHELVRLHPATVFTAEAAGHGTTMFTNHPGLVEQVADWVATNAH